MIYVTVPIPEDRVKEFYMNFATWLPETESKPELNSESDTNEPSLSSREKKLIRKETWFNNTKRAKDKRLTPTEIVEKVTKVVNQEKDFQQKLAHEEEIGREEQIQNANKIRIAYEQKYEKRNSSAPPPESTTNGNNKPAPVTNQTVQDFTSTKFVNKTKTDTPLWLTAAKKLGLPTAPHTHHKTQDFGQKIRRFYREDHPRNQIELHETNRINFSTISKMLKTFKYDHPHYGMFFIQAVQGFISARTRIHPEDLKALDEKFRQYQSTTHQW